MGDRLSHPRVRKNWKDLLGFRKYQFLLKEFQKYPDRIPFYDSLDGFVSNYSSLFGPLMKEYSNVTYGYDRSQSDSADILLTKLICNTYLLENGVAQGDRLSMSNSVELRLPLLDYKLVETIIGLRKSNSDIYGTPKKVLKDVARDMLPEWLFNIPKRGFTPPVEE
ncbi:asparagine synthase-related protein, partial [Parabacteroides distasonis]|uniref:asparagine synthase-related protein n=1 Tax=Parabacteroides distasonis TaxID=823 RepID=UPI00325A8F0E